MMDTEQKIALTEIQARIIEKLQSGHRNAIGLKDLCRRLDENERRVRLAIEALRNEGYLVLFGQKLKAINAQGEKIVLPSGYFLGETYAEAMEFYAYMQSRVIDECRIMRSVKLAAKAKYERAFGQLPMWLK